MKEATGTLENLTLVLNEALVDMATGITAATGTLASATSQLNLLLTWAGSAITPATGTLPSAVATHNLLRTELMTRTVTGTIKHIDGTAWASGAVRFDLLEEYVEAGETHPRESHTETTDVAGAFSITLSVPTTGTAAYSVTTPDGITHEFNLAAGAATTLEIILAALAPYGTQNTFQTMIDASNIVAVTTKVALYTIDAADELIRCDGTFTVTLPAATGSGKLFVVKNVGVGVITVAAGAGDTIDGAATATIAVTYDVIGLLDSLATVWDIL